MCPISHGFPHELFTAEMAQSAHMSNLNLEWEEVLPLASFLSYPKHSIIPHQRLRGLYYVKSGTVTLVYTSSCGRERTTLYFEAGMLFNEARSFTDYDPGGSFICLTDVELYFFPREKLMSLEFIQQHPKLIRNLMATMGAKILLHYSFLADMGTGSHLVHMCRLILRLSNKNNHALQFSPDMTQQEVASLLGVHRTTLARTLGRLKNMGIISKFTRNEVCIVNYDMLRQLAES